MSANSVAPFSYESPRLFVATPMYGGMCAGQYMASMLHLSRLCAEAGVGMSFSFLQNESLIQRGRNTLIQTAMKTGFTHFLFIDADILFAAEDVLSMLSLDLPVTCGVYPKKEINWQSLYEQVAQESVQRLMQLPDATNVTAESIINAIRPGTGNPEKKVGSFVMNMMTPGEYQLHCARPYPVKDAGTGFMLINRGVFDALAQADLAREYKSDHNGEMLRLYFDCGIDEDDNRYLSEDYWFCRQCQKLGIDVHIAPWVQLSHVGTYVFSGSLMN
jgi:hypothetical protein